MDSVTKQRNTIESAVFRKLHPLGFTRHGNTLHRFVSGDISQVIHFQCGPARLNTTPLLSVNIGIRIPECAERRFFPVNDKAYYHEYECNIRSRLGILSSKSTEGEKAFPLDGDTEVICRDILEEIEEDVLPLFEILSNRQAILAHRGEYPWFDIVGSHMAQLEAAMIYGHLGNRQKAKELFDAYYESVLHNPEPRPGHIAYLDTLRTQIGLS